MSFAIYLRVSTEEQNEENQRAQCETWMRQRFPGENAEVYRDRQSAWKDNVEREGFDKLNDALIHGKHRHVIVWDLDRLFRNRRKCVEFIRNFARMGVSVHSVRQEWLEHINKMPVPWNEIMGDMMLHVVAWMGEEESKKKSDRVRIAYQNHKGKRWGRPEVKLNVDEALLLRSRGWSYAKIAERLEVSKTKVYEALHGVQKSNEVSSEGKGVQNAAF